MPVEVFELVGASGIGGACRRRRCGGSRAPGRDTELAALGQALERAGADQGQVVAVVGEAGVGEVPPGVRVCAFPARRAGWCWRVPRCPTVKATSYFPVIDLLKRYVQVEDADEPRTVRAKGYRTVLTLDETLQETIPALLWLPDALPDDSPLRTLDPPQQRQRPA